MKILMVTYRFPPYNSIGAVRCGKMAKYLIELGHEVKVISCENQPLPATLPLEIPEENVFYTSWWNINKPVEILLGRKKNTSKESLNTAGNKNTLRSSILRILGKAYKALFHVPDGQMGWRNAAYLKGLEITSEWRPDVIYASAWPISSLIVADKLSRATNIPWVGELRDLWTDNPYNDAPRWKIKLERIWEKRVFDRAAGLTTISDHAAETLASKYSCPIKIILNGFDEPDHVQTINAPEYSSVFSKNTLNILYAGMIYPGRRDPAPLLQAVSMLPDNLRGKVNLHFYGSQLGGVDQIARSLKIEQFVMVNKPIAYKEILALQRKADYLLLLMWDNPLEKGTFTGKFFEYVGSGRPIICVGGQENPPARLIKERKLGQALNDPNELLDFLKEAILQKENDGCIAGLPQDAGSGLSRKEQAKILSDFLNEIV